jgi:hypothetical protein
MLFVTLHAVGGASLHKSRNKQRKHETGLFLAVTWRCYWHIEGPGLYLGIFPRSRVPLSHEAAQAWLLAGGLLINRPAIILGIFILERKCCWTSLCSYGRNVGREGRTGQGWLKKGKYKREEKRERTNGKHGKGNWKEGKERRRKKVVR